MFLNFTGQSLTILLLFVGLSFVSFFISLPFICSKEVLRKDEIAAEQTGGEAQ